MYSLQVLQIGGRNKFLFDFAPIFPFIWGLSKPFLWGLFQRIQQQWQYLRDGYLYGGPLQSMFVLVQKQSPNFVTTIYLVAVLSIVSPTFIVSSPHISLGKQWYSHLILATFFIYRSLPQTKFLHKVVNSVSYGFKDFIQLKKQITIAMMVVENFFPSCHAEFSLFPLFEFMLNLVNGPFSNLLISLPSQLDVI